MPQSGVKIASYAGPSAPADRLREAEAIASGLRLVRTGDPSVRPEPPPPGSRPGLPLGTLPVPESGIETFGRPVLVMRGPGTQPSTVVIFRTGPNLARFSARLADGRTVNASTGIDGWGLVASDGRIVGVRGDDTQGGAVPEQLVG